MLRLAEDLDPVARYGMAKGFAIRSRTVIVEGTSDVDLIHMAAELEEKATGRSLLGHDLAIVAPGQGKMGGTDGLIRELLRCRGYAETYLLPNGLPRYRFIGLFDNDDAGRKAVKLAKQFDRGILEYRDVLCLKPIMPRPDNLDHSHVQKTFEQENKLYGGLDWELEDLLPQDFIDGFLADYPNAVRECESAHGKVHREFTIDGKAHLHRFVKQNAMREDLAEVIRLIEALRHYMVLK